MKPISNQPKPIHTTQTQQTLASTTTTHTQQTTQTQHHNAPAPDQMSSGVDHGAHNAAHDMRYRVGVNAVTSGATQTAVPDLIKDWKTSLCEAAAEERAFDEVIAAPLAKALSQAEAQKGDELSRGEKRDVKHDVQQSLKKEYKNSLAEHHKDIVKSPSTKAKTERDVLLSERPRVDKLKDPFTAVIQNQPGARANEIVLWENKNAMVVVDTFADSPKALVVPKMPVSLPVDAPKGLLDEVSLIAAHVSDAFMRATGCPAAGIWVNPPQHLTVKQMHVHVLPDLGTFTQDGAPAKAFLEDAQFRPQLEAYFDVIKDELKKKLGAPST